MSSKLQCLVVADPLPEVAQDIANACDRLAEQRLVTTTGAETLTQARALRPEAIVLSLELTKPDTLDIAAKLCKELPNTLIVITYRELAVPMMEKLARLGLGDFVAQPVDITELFRAASRRFDRPFRRHDRHAVTLELYRADGVLVGKTRDLSEGGLLMDAIHPVKLDESMLLDLMLDDKAGKPLRVRCRVLAVDGQQPAPVKARVQFERLWGPEQRRLRDYIQTLVKTNQEEP